MNTERIIMNTDRIIMDNDRVIMDTEKKSYITPEIQVIDTSLTNVILTSDVNDKIDTDEIEIDFSVLS